MSPNDLKKFGLFQNKLRYYKQGVGVVDLEFSRALYVEIAHDISMPCRISKGCNKILRIYKDGIGFVFSGSSEGKVANLEISEVCSKKCTLSHLAWVFL